MNDGKMLHIISDDKLFVDYGFKRLFQEDCLTYFLLTFLYAAKYIE